MKIYYRIERSRKKEKEEKDKKRDCLEDLL
jgi:hypothetical protein